MNMDVLLAALVEQKGSDLFITVDAPPTLKVNGRLAPLGDKPLDRQAALALVRESLDEAHFSATCTPGRPTTPFTARGWGDFGSAPSGSRICLAWCCAASRPAFPPSRN